MSSSGQIVRFPTTVFVDDPWAKLRDLSTALVPAFKFLKNLTRTENPNSRTPLAFIDLSVDFVIHDGGIATSSCRMPGRSACTRQSVTLILLYSLYRPFLHFSSEYTSPIAMRSVPLLHPSTRSRICKFHSLSTLNSDLVQGLDDLSVAVGSRCRALRRYFTFSARHYSE